MALRHLKVNPVLKIDETVSKQVESMCSNLSKYSINEILYVFNLFKSYIEEYIWIYNIEWIDFYSLISMRKIISIEVTRFQSCTSNAANILPSHVILFSQKKSKSKENNIFEAFFYEFTIVKNTLNMYFSTLITIFIIDIISVKCL